MKYVRALWNWQRYGRWTTCQHPKWETRRMAYAVSRAKPIPRGPDELWTMCSMCGVVRSRQPWEGRY